MKRHLVINVVSIAIAVLGIGIDSRVTFAEVPDGDHELSVSTHFTYGPLGPERPPVFAAGEWVIVRLDVHGISKDVGRKKIKFSMEIEVKDKSNNSIRKLAPHHFDDIFPLGGSNFTQALSLILPPEAPEGEYSVEVVVTDHQSNKTAKSSLSFKYLSAATFRIANVFLAKDRKGEVPVGAVFTAGEYIYVHGVISRMSAVDGRARVTPSVAVLDDKEAPIHEIVNPRTKELFYDADHSHEPTGVQVLTPLFLNRSGRFVVRIKAVDEHNGEVVAVLLPISVVEVPSNK